MSKTAMVRARLEPDLKEHTEEIFKKLGLSVTQAITLFYKQVEIKKGLPFNLHVSNEETIKIFQDTDKEINLIKCKNAKDMFEQLGI
jgi:DNA-damage-inducible protein J